MNLLENRDFPISERKETILKDLGEKSKTKKSAPESELRITPEIEKFFLDEPTGHPMYGKPAKPPTKESTKTVLADLIRKTGWAQGC
jgi:hypothetical protein